MNFENLVNCIVNNVWNTTQVASHLSEPHFEHPLSLILVVPLDDT